MFSRMVQGWVERFKGWAGAGLAGSFRLWTSPAIISDKLQQSKSFENVEVPQIQFIVTVLDIPVAMQRRLPTVQTVQKAVEFLQRKLWRFRSCGDLTKLSMSLLCSSSTVVYVPVIMQRRGVSRTVKVPQIQFIALFEDIPVVHTAQLYAGLWRR